MATLDGTIPESFPLLPQFFATDVPSIDSLVANARFGCRQRHLIELRRDRRPYSWTALHAAAKRGNIAAVKSLLVHGAYVDSKCEGFCGCLTPTCQGPKSGERPPAWTALHLAVCSGNQDLVRFLLSHGANYLDVGDVGTASYSAIPGAQGGSPRPRPTVFHDMTSRARPARTPEDGEPITAFHSVALTGDIDMCRLLLDHHDATCPGDNKNILDRRDFRQQRAIDYAVAAGHTRTLAVWMLEQRSCNRRLSDVKNHAEPILLRYLCYRGSYRDAEYLLERTRPSAEGCTQVLHMGFATLHTSSKVPYLTRLGSLQVLLDEYMETVVTGKRRLPEYDSEEDLISLARQLCRRGADPGAIVDVGHIYHWTDFRGMGKKSAFQLAASCGYLKAAQLLLQGGAPLDLGELHTSAAVSQILTSPLDMRDSLAATVTFLERGAVVRHWPPGEGWGESADRWFRPFFEPFIQHMTSSPRRMWYDLRSHHLFERLLGVSAKRLGKDEFPAEWVPELLSTALAIRGSTGDFCKWYVRTIACALGTWFC